MSRAGLDQDYDLRLQERDQHKKSLAAVLVSKPGRRSSESRCSECGSILIFDQGEYCCQTCGVVMWELREEQPPLGSTQNTFSERLATGRKGSAPLSHMEKMKLGLITKPMVSEDIDNMIDIYRLIEKISNNLKASLPHNTLNQAKYFAKRVRSRVNGRASHLAISLYSICEACRITNISHISTSDLAEACSQVIGRRITRGEAFKMIGTIVSKLEMQYTHATPQAVLYNIIRTITQVPSVQARICVCFNPVEYERALFKMSAEILSACNESLSGKNPWFLAAAATLASDALIVRGLLNKEHGLIRIDDLANIDRVGPDGVRSNLQHLEQQLSGKTLKVTINLRPKRPTWAISSWNNGRNSRYHMK